MSRKDAVYKLAYEYAKANEIHPVAAFLVRHKSKLKEGKADAILNFFIKGNLGNRLTQNILQSALDNYDRSSSCVGYEEIRKAFPQGISSVNGTAYLKNNKDKYEDFRLQGGVSCLIINNTKMSENIIIKTNTGLKIIINKNDEKSSLFIIKSSEVLLPYDLTGWKRSFLAILTAGTPLSRYRQIRLGGEPVIVKKQTPLEQFLETRTMNLMPSKRQLAKIDKQKRKLFGPDEGEQDMEDVLRPRAALNLREVRF